MSDSEEDLDDFPVENRNKLAESMVGAYRAKSTDQWTAANGTSWFKYEELTDDWLDPAVLEAEKRGPAMKNRFVGDADMKKDFLTENP